MAKIWTPEEFILLKEYYPDNRTADILKFFPGRTVIGLNNISIRYGIFKSNVYHEKGFGGRRPKLKPLKKRVEVKCFDYVFLENIRNSKKGCFKKGQDPYNTVPIGSERITKDGYIEVKVNHFKDGSAKNRNFVLKHRLLWESHNGPILEGMIVVIKTGDKINFTINDLELITKRENVIRNGRCDTAIVKKYLSVKESKIIEKIIGEIPDLIQLKRTNLILNSQIKNYENNN